MCYLCMSYNPSAVFNDRSTPSYKRTRAIELKQLIRLAEEITVCGSGDEALSLLKEEQYRLSREL